MIVVFTELFFTFFNGFSGQIFFADWLPMMYNAFYTALPCIINYAFEQDVTKEYSYRFPVLYKAGTTCYYFNYSRFWRWIMVAAWHGTVCFWIPVYGLTGVSDSSGYVKGHWYISTISFCLIMHVITIKLFLETTFWNKLNV